MSTARKYKSGDVLYETKVSEGCRVRLLHREEDGRWLVEPAEPSTRRTRSRLSDKTLDNHWTRAGEKRK